MVRMRLDGCGHVLGPVAVALLTFFVCCIPAACGGDTAAQIRQRLDAGEFGPAIALAQTVEDAALRDKLLRDIAVAQFSAGARQGSLDTAYEISSDIVRKETFDGITVGRGAQRGARGGAAMADFDSLIELITSTVKPDSWDDVGGPGAIDSFRGGVYVDSSGLLSRLPKTTDPSLIAIHRASMDTASTGDPHKSAVLRKVSLTRLEREVQLLAAQGRRS